MLLVSIKNVLLKKKKKVSRDVRGYIFSERWPYVFAVGSEPMETLEDIYIGSVETDRGTREQVRFYDTRGLRDSVEFPRHYFGFADGFVLVYSIDSKESFKRMEFLKKEIDRCRDKKEVRVWNRALSLCSESFMMYAAEISPYTVELSSSFTTLTQKSQK